MLFKYSIGFSYTFASIRGPNIFCEDYKNIWKQIMIKNYDPVVVTGKEYLNIIGFVDFFLLHYTPHSIRNSDSWTGLVC